MRDGLGSDFAVSDHDKLTRGWYTILHEEDHRRARLEDVGIRRHLRDVNGDLVRILSLGVRSRELEVSLTHVDSVSGEARSDEDNLDAGRIDRRVLGSIGDVPVVTAVRKRAGPARHVWAGLVVPRRVELLNFVASAPLAKGDVFVGVGSSNHDGTVGEENGRRVVHALLARSGEPVSGEAGPKGGIGAAVSISLAWQRGSSLVDRRHIDRILTI